MIFPEDTPISKPVLVAKEYPVHLFQKNDLESLGETYKASIVELMRQSECDLLPTAYLHLRRNPFDLEDTGDYLYEMHINQSNLPYPMLQSIFERLTRLVVTRGEARGVAVLMRAMALDVDSRTKTETMVVTVETEASSKAWFAPFSACQFHGLHYDEFQEASDSTWRTFPDLMKPLSLSQFMAENKGRAAATNAIDVLAQKLGVALEKVKS